MGKGQPRTRFDEILEQYRAQYDIDSLSSPNDQANLHALIQNQVMIEKLQTDMQLLAEEDARENIVSIAKISDTINSMLERSLQLERALALDRKTRKQNEASSVADYLRELKIMAREFVDAQLIKLQCPDCLILVGRIAPLEEHTGYAVAFECPQCHKPIKATRKSKDPFFDLPANDREWRKKYTYEVIPLRAKTAPVLPATDELVIADEDTSGDELDTEGAADESTPES